LVQVVLEILEQMLFLQVVAIPFLVISYLQMVDPLQIDLLGDHQEAVVPTLQEQ